MRTDCVNLICYLVNELICCLTGAYKVFRSLRQILIFRILHSHIQLSIAFESWLSKVAYMVKKRKSFYLLSSAIKIKRMANLGYQPSHLNQCAAVQTQILVSLLVLSSTVELYFSPPSENQTQNPWENDNKHYTKMCRTFMSILDMIYLHTKYCNYRVTNVRKSSTPQR